MNSYAALLLSLGMLRHYAWEAAPPEAMIHIWNITTAAAMTVMLWMLAYRWRVTLLIALWWSFEELQVVACSTWLLLRSAQVVQGQGQCSSLLGFDLSSVGLLCVALVLASAPVSSYRSKRRKDVS